MSLPPPKLELPATPAPRATLQLAEAAARRWDVLVVGAGPAGALAAYLAARRGKTVLLVDKAVFPRWKVCGSCLNAAALATLERAGLGSLVTRQGAVALHELRLGCGGSQANVALTGGVSLSRQRLDALLVEQAVAASAHFLPDTHASLGPAGDALRSLELRQGDQRQRVWGRVLLVADGLGGRLLDSEPGFQAQIAPHARLGAGTTLADAPAWYRRGTIHMVIGRAGYAGLVRLEEGQLDIAAALDPPAVRAAGGIAPLVRELLASADFPPLPQLDELPWRGTPLLTRRRIVAGQRLLVLGDAAGYVEPFTGEGIAWALLSAEASAPLVAAAAQAWSPALVTQWQGRHRTLLAARQRRCRWIARALRSRVLTRAAVAALHLAPQLVRPVLRGIDAPPSPPSLQCRPT